MEIRAMRKNKSGSTPDELEMLRLRISEADRQLLVEQHTASALTTRAALLITAAGVFISLGRYFDQAAGPSWWALLLSVGLAFCSAAMGVSALFMRQSRDIDLAGLWRDVYTSSLADFIGKVTAAKNELLEQTTKNNRCRSRAVRFGFIMMLAAMALAILSFALPS